MAFPVGVPRVLKREHFDGLRFPWTASTDNPYRGMLYCRVLPPRDLRIPVLPYKTFSGALMFPLCAKCAEDANQRECNHLERQRQWIWGGAHVELNKALDRGYRVLELYEVKVCFGVRQILV